MNYTRSYRSKGFKNSKSYGGIIKCTKSEKYLLVQGKTGKWSFPKGHRNKGESEEECAVREIYEETGLTIDDISKKQIIHPSFYYYFYIETEAEYNTKIIDHSEINDVKWMHPNDIEIISKNADVREYFRKIKSNCPKFLLTNKNHKQ